MKIGVITFWDSQDNYGQLLQCYALQTYLKKMGHEVYLIKYLPTNSRQSLANTIKHYFTSLNIKHIRAFFKYKKSLKIQAEFQKTHPRFFDDFRTNFIKSTEKCYYGYRALWVEDWSSFDALIAGSDQVWSYSTEENLHAYFLDWGPFNLKRIAYAVSFGRKTLPSDYEQILSILLSNLDFVGLREQSGVDLCRHRGRLDAQLVCDPTLLLSGNDYYSEIVGDWKDRQANSIFCYLLNWETLFPYEELNEFIKREGLETKYIPAHGVEDENYFVPMEKLSIPSWLESIKSAQYVVTNSFHGTVFCILFHKQFMTLPLIGQSEVMNDRIVTLLKQLGLEDRIYDIRTNCEELLKDEINWEKVDERLEKFRNNSKDFLNAALGQKNTPERKKRTICFQTNGGVNHDNGGLDRVTELLADYFEGKGNTVYYLSFTRRENTTNGRQYYLPNAEILHSQENIDYYNKFLKEKEVDVLINQEGNVNIHLPHNVENDKIVYLTVLHFEPNYIKGHYFEYRIMSLAIPAFVKKVMSLLICKTNLKILLVWHLRRKLRKNYHYQIANCDRFILLSDRFKHDLLAFFPANPPKNVFAINNPSTFRLVDIQDKAIMANKKNEIIYVGRLELYQKKLDSLLRIWKKTSIRHPNWVLKIVGDGPDKQTLIQQVAIEEIKNVSFEGQQSPLHYYEEASIFCLTSGHEGWGMVLVEAQSYGCVPMAFDSYSSLRDIIQDGKTGIIVPPFEEELYAEKLGQLIDNAESRRQMAIACMENTKRFSISNIGEMWLKMIESTEFSKQR